MGRLCIKGQSHRGAEIGNESDIAAERQHVYSTGALDLFIAPEERDVCRP